MASFTINQSLTVPSQLERSMGLPAEGPKCIPLSFDFTAFDTYILDYQNMTARGFIRMIQAFYADNSDSGVPLIVTVQSLGQRLIVPSQSCGYFPLIVPNPIRISFSCPGGPATTSVVLLNFPVQPNTWKVT